MFAAILAAITAIFQAIPLIGKWLTTPLEQKTEDEQAQIEKESEDFKKSGRPDA